MVSCHCLGGSISHAIDDDTVSVLENADFGSDYKAYDDGDDVVDVDDDDDDDDDGDGDGDDDGGDDDNDEGGGDGGDNISSRGGDCLHQFTCIRSWALAFRPFWVCPFNVVFSVFCWQH